MAIYWTLGYWKGTQDSVYRGKCNCQLFQGSGLQCSPHFFLSAVGNSRRLGHLWDKCSNIIWFWSIEKSTSAQGWWCHPAILHSSKAFLRPHKVVSVYRHCRQVRAWKEWTRRTSEKVDKKEQWFRVKACHSTAFQSHCIFGCCPYDTIHLKSSIWPTDHRFPRVCQSGLPLMWKKIWIQALEWRRLRESPTKYFVTPPRCSWKHLSQSRRKAETSNPDVPSLLENKKTHAKEGTRRQGYWERTGNVVIGITSWSDVSGAGDVPVLSSFAPPPYSQTFTEHTTGETWGEDAG